ncbi:hypothetical protein AAMO2058_000188500 [Amorphochlora amoebiformis]
MKSGGLSPAKKFKPNEELILNLKMRVRLGEFKATDEQIITALKKAGNVGRKAIGYLKGEKRLYEHRKGDSMIGLANTMAANIIQPVRRNSLNASDAQLIEQVVRGSTEGLEEAKNKVEEKTSS